MARHKTVTFGPVVRFRSFEGDVELMRVAAKKRKQTVSAYIRDAVMAHTLEDLGFDTREAALRDIHRPEIGSEDL